MGRTRIDNGWGETMRLGFIGLGALGSRRASRLHEAARSKGVPVLDAPVSGSTLQAEQGQLVIFVGGEEAVYQKCQSILAVLGSKTFYLGPSGSGATMKLCVNTLLGLGVQALAEAIALGVKAGLPRERFLQVLGETAVISPSQKTKLENVRTDEYPPAFALRLMFKDFGLIVETGMDLAVPMPATAAAVQVAAAERARQLATHTDEDFSVIVRAMERLAGVA